MSHSTDSASKRTFEINDSSDAAAEPPADGGLVELARAYENLEPKAMEMLDVAEARRQPTVADAVRALLLEQGRSADPEQLVPGVSALEIEVGGVTDSLPATVYTPIGTGGAGPVVLYFHGGGWVIANRKVYDGGARNLASEANAIVVSVDYRQAPEHKFPAAWDDALAAYRWLTMNAHTLGGDPGRLALAGEGAGGNLALATAIAARDTDLTQPRHVLSVCPVAQTSLGTKSYVEQTLAKPLNRAMMRWFFNQVVRSESDLVDPRLSLINADLRSLPPVTIINASIDPLRSDGILLEDALRKAGGSVERREFEGVTHEFFGAAAVLQKACEAQAFAGERLRKSFGG